MLSFHLPADRHPEAERMRALARRIAASLSLYSPTPAPVLFAHGAIFAQQLRFGGGGPRDKPSAAPLQVGRSPGGRLALFEGWLDNRRELGERLGCGSEDPATIYAAAVERWGDRADLEAIGSYCAVVFDPAGRTARLARSPWSAPPLHYFEGPEGTTAASVPRVLHLCGAPRELDERKLADNLYCNLTEDRGWYRDSFRVGLGTIVHLGQGPRRTVAYYDHLAPRRTRLADDRAYVEAAGALLDEAAERALDGAREPGVLLSGGLDSATVAAKLLGRMDPGRRLKTFTFVPHPGWDGRIDGNYFGDDRPLVEAFAAMHPRIDPFFCASEGRDAASGLDRMIQAMGIAPVGLPNMYMFHELYAEAARRGCDVLFDADLGNRTLSNEGGWALVEHLLRGRFVQLWRALRAVSPGNGSLPAIFVRRSLLPLLPDRAWRRWRGLRGDTAAPGNQRVAMVRDEAVCDHRLDHRARAAGVLFARPYLRSRRAAIVDSFARGDMDGGDVAQGFEQLYGVRTRDVTAYRPLVEFCLGLPTRMFLRDGEDRWLARRVARGLLPEAQRTNRRQGFHNVDWHARMTPRLDHYKAEIERARALPEVARLIDLDAVGRALDEWPERGSVKPGPYARFALAAPRALMAAQLVRFATGRNSA